MISFKREKECALAELVKAQDIIAQLKSEKNGRSIEFDANNVELLNKKLSMKTYIYQLKEKNKIGKIIMLNFKKHWRGKSTSWKRRTKGMLMRYHN
jgi:hypothetical protein